MTLFLVVRIDAMVDTLVCSIDSVEKKTLGQLFVRKGSGSRYLAICEIGKG
jgi:hypothetical protein